ncbi:MAG TPA: hypothetical protein PKA06_15385, partial [Gemmatales bacterium]|nr:hypothetical protein [Gemmatales bacterium]
YKQIVDSLSATVSASPADDTTALAAFKNYAEQVAKQAPGSEIASYAKFRVMMLENNLRIAKFTKAEDHLQAQANFAEILTAFVNAYPKGSDTPEAMHHLGEIYELLNKDNDARRWYETVVAKYPENKFA